MKMIAASYENIKRCIKKAAKRHLQTNWLLFSLEQSAVFHLKDT